MQLIIFVDDLPIILKRIASEGYVFEMKVLLISCVLAFVFGNVQGMLYILFKLHKDLCSFPHFIYGYTLFYSQLTPLSLSLYPSLSLVIMLWTHIFNRFFVIVKGTNNNYFYPTFTASRRDRCPSSDKVQLMDPDELNKAPLCVSDGECGQEEKCCRTPSGPRCLDTVDQGTYNHICRELHSIYVARYMMNWVMSYKAW